MHINKAWVVGVTSVGVSRLDVEWREGDRMLRPSTVVIKSDERIRSAVEDAFRYDPRIAPFDVVVAVENGTVTLVGTVATLQAKPAAEEDAYDTLGVDRVNNHLKIRMDSPPQDSEIVQKVREALRRDPIVEMYDIGVSVKNRKVYLSGAVNRLYERERAEGVASAVFGVVAVSNALTVSPVRIAGNDREIKENIESELFWSMVVDHDDIAVSVTDGVATLTGTVDHRHELKAAVENAFEGGAHSVRSRLKARNGGEQYYGDYGHR